MKSIVLALAIVLSLVLVSCGGGGRGGGQQKQDITVSLGPKTATVSGGETQQFTASILNPNNTGVTWTLAGVGCTGAACGTLGNVGGNNNQGWTIVYTAPLTVPNPATVTLTATSKDDTTKSDTASVTITAAVVKVGVDPSTPTVILGATQQFTATVTGTANTAVTWSTAGPGTISSSGLYSAPATAHTPSAVTVTATSQADNTKAATATINIPAVSVSTSPSISKLYLGDSQRFSGSVANATDASIDWSVWGPGTVDRSGLYTAPTALPAATTVSVTAAAHADPDKHMSVEFTLIVTPTVSPLIVTVPAGAAQQFTADMPVTWTVGGVAGTDPATWGTISADGRYAAPLNPPWTGKLNITATSKVDPTHSANSVATIVFSNASLQGHYAMRYRGLDGASPLFGVGSFEADGNGAILSGSISFYETGIGPAESPVTGGMYTVGPDGRGTATLSLQSGGQAQQFPIRFVMTSNSSARIIGFDDTGTGWGNLDLQVGLTASADLSGTYVFMADGFVDTLQPLAVAGMFTAGGGIISSGLADLNMNGSVSQNVAFTGTYTPLSLYQPFAATFDGSGALVHFTLYQLSPDLLIFVSADAGTGYSGVAVRQDTSAPYSNSSLSGNLVMMSTGYSDSGNHQDAVALGRFTADGAGGLADGVVDIILNHGGQLSTVSYKVPSTGTFSIQPNGHGSMTVYVEGNPSFVSVYMVGPNNLFYVSQMPYTISTGQLMPQASGSYSLSTIRGSWGLNLRESLYYWTGTDVVAQLSSDAAGNLTGKSDVNAPGTLSPDLPLTGTYTMEANGRGEVTLNINGNTAHYVVYAASGRTLYLMPLDTNKLTAVGVAARQF